MTRTIDLPDSGESVAVDGTVITVHTSGTINRHPVLELLFEWSHETRETSATQRAIAAFIEAKAVETLAQLNVELAAAYNSADRESARRRLERAQRAASRARSEMHDTAHANAF